MWRCKVKLNATTFLFGKLYFRTFIGGYMTKIDSYSRVWGWGLS
jgi:hypothetical protein